MIEKNQLALEFDNIEDNLGDEDIVIPFNYTITSYGADYPVSALVNRLERDDIFIPHFQREYVWSKGDASRFIESLLLGLPVPGIFLSKEYESERMLVIDGQQRLKSLLYFYNGYFEPLDETFSLRSVQEEYKGATYESLESSERRKLDDSIIHATIVKQDEPSDDNSSIYHIFERLNSGGKKLRSQEIRACVYHGPFEQLLEELNENYHWREIYGPKSKRMRDMELILRFLALYFHRDEYDRPMKGFLNRYMGANRQLDLQSGDLVADVFETTIEEAYRCFGEDAFKPSGSLNASVFDSVMVGLAFRLEEGPIENQQMARDRYGELLRSRDFKSAYQRSTADRENVRTRVELSINAFSDIK